jgi:hypothetical protein
MARIKMENRKIGKSIGYVDASRRPYAAFVLGNPELVKGADLVTYAGQLDVYEAEPERFRALYDSLVKGLYRMVKGLPENGPALEDADIICYSRLGELAGQTFDEIKSQSNDPRIKRSCGPTPPGSTVYGAMAYLHFLRGVSEFEADKLIETAPIGGLWASETWKQLSTEDLKKVIEIGRDWENREDGKYIAIRNLEREIRNAGQRMPEGLELGRFLEEKIGLDYGGYDWKSYESRRPPYFNDGLQFINVIVGKSHLIGDLENEFARRK